MNVSIIGSGRLGLSLGVILARAGFTVFMTDKNPKKRGDVTGEDLSFYEPDLQDGIKENQSRLKWTRLPEKIVSSQFIFFCLSTPVTKHNDLDITEILEWVNLIAENMNTKNTSVKKYLIIKSTLSLGTNKKIHSLIQEKKKPLFVLTVPEFLSQGQALRDIVQPERLVIGAREPESGKIFEEFWTQFSKPQKVIHTDPETAELSKLACNSFLATKISFINEFTGLCELIQADPEKLQLILGTDSRIGPGFLTPGLGYGGYCLPKDIQLSLREGEKRHQSMDVLKSVQQVNKTLPPLFFRKILSHYKNLNDVSLAFWGITFKKDTDDIKNSPALSLLCLLLKAGADLHVYDPLFVKDKVFDFLKKSPKEPQAFHFKHMLNTIQLLETDPLKILRQKILEGKILFHKTAQDSLEQRQGLIIGSDCDEFTQISLRDIKKKLKQPFLVDSRGLFSTEALKAAGFSFYQKGCYFKHNS